MNIEDRVARLETESRLHRIVLAQLLRCAPEPELLRERLMLAKEQLSAIALGSAKTTDAEIERLERGLEDWLKAIP